MFASTAIALAFVVASRPAGPVVRGGGRGGMSELWRDFEVVQSESDRFASWKVIPNVKATSPNPSSCTVLVVSKA